MRYFRKPGSDLRYIKITTDIRDPDAFGGIYRAVGGVLELDCVLADIIPKMFYHYESRKNDKGEIEFFVVVPKEYFSIISDLMYNMLVAEVKMKYVINFEELLT